MHRMCGIVRSRERVHRITGRHHLVRCDGAIVVEHHRRGEVGREVLDAVDRVQNCVPPAHSIEVGLTDPMDGRLGVHALVERVGILHRIAAEKVNRIVQHGHGFRLRGAVTSVNGARRSCKAGFECIGRRLLTRSP